MHDADRREPATGNPAHTLPGHVSLLAAPAESTLPKTGDLMVEGFEGIEVQGHSVVVDVPADDRGQPSPHLRDGIMPALPKLAVDLLQLRPQPLPHGQPQHNEASLPRLPADVREAEEVERLGLAPSVPLPVRRRMTAEFE